MTTTTLGITLSAALSVLLVSCSGSSGSQRAPVNDAQQDMQQPLDNEPDTNTPSTGNQTPSSVSSHFQFTISDAVAAKNTARWNAYVRLQVESALAPLNNIQGLLDAGIPVTYDECGIVNAFYDPFARAITLCDELVETLLVFWEGRTDRVVQSLNFILYHEIGHALADVLRLPITGNEESAADAYAAVISGETDRAFGTVIGGLFLAADQSSFGDEHTNGEDRSGDIVCWALGSDSTLLSNSTLDAIIQPFIDARRDCAAEYQRQNQSVLFTVPALTMLEASPITNPDVIALSDPNPPKTEGESAPSSALLASLQTTGENEFWVCDSQFRTAQVIFGFNEFGGLFQEIGVTTSTLFFSSQETSANTLTLIYNHNGFAETLSDIQITGSVSFTALSDVEGELVCEREQL